MRKLGWLFLLVALAVTSAGGWREGSAASWRKAARQAAAWILSTAPDRGIWPSVPGGEGPPPANLYSGVAGITLFMLELARLEDPTFLAEGRRGADYLLLRLSERESPIPSGLYTGLAGMGYVLEEAFQATGDPRYREGFLEVLRRLREEARSVGAGKEWNEVTDIVGGSAGIGLLLLYAHRSLGDPVWLDLAQAAGRRLLELAQETEENGSKWFMSPGYPRNMPNFSHGTAGIAYFLAELYEATGEEEFLEGALRGARYLISISRRQGEACLIFHHEPGGEQLFYLSWCHGPAGTGRLFYQLWKVTGQSQWREWLLRLARGILSSGIPTRRTEGFWNNVGQCCGSAGVAEFFLELFQLTGEESYLHFTQVMARDLLKRAERTSQGLRWVQAEHRIRPDFLLAQTGYMQGAAGIGMLLLHLGESERGRGRWLRLPDNPFDGEPAGQKQKEAGSPRARGRE